MKSCLLRFRLRLWVTALVAAAIGAAAGAAPLRFTLRTLAEWPPGTGQFEPRLTTTDWIPEHTAAVVCDMWDQHWCRGATARVAELAPRMNAVIHRLREQGVLILHCPSGTLKFYAGTPQRQLAHAAPQVDAQVPLKGWCHLDPKREAPLPIDDADGGCDDDPPCQHPPYPWTRQIATIEIQAGDAITDSAEAYYLMRQRGLTNVIVMGVHENMCVLGRPFSIRQLVHQGQNVVLMRDLTDTMYNSRQRPFVDHFTGTDLVAWHIERYWCPTITSDQILGGAPFRFAADTKPPRRFNEFAWRFHRDSHPVGPYNVVWDSPSKDSAGSMPLGNGDLGLNAWMEANGDLLLLLSKTDAWDEKDHLLKLGRVRVRTEPAFVQTNQPFRQELKLHHGEICFHSGQSTNARALRIWVDAHHPVVRLEAHGAAPFRLRAELEIWRTSERALAPGEANGVDQFAKDEPPKVYPDRVVEDQADRITWYHRNERSIWAATLRHQGLAALIPQFQDPLLHRTFGGTIEGDGLTRLAPQTLASHEPGTSFTLRIHAWTAPTPTAADWQQQLERIVHTTRSVPEDQAHRAHREWWSAFWDRSWIRVTGSGTASAIARWITPNTLPLRLGADSDGQNRFRGEMGRVAVYSRALDADEVQRLARSFPPPTERPSGCLREWVFSGGPAAEYTNRLASATMPRRIGHSPLEEIADGFGGRNVRFTGQGFFEFAHATELAVTNAVTLEAWIKPDALPSGGGRILDKSKAGTANGYLLDTYPGNSLRLIVEDGALSYDAKLPTNQWSHVAGVFDARTGEKKLYLNGQMVASGGDRREVEPDHVIVSRGYTLQRFMNACAGRGGSPIKFNGSIFTVDVPGQFDPDYRRWGGCYWFQNTRLPYWPMLASGDFDLMQPLFAMYRDALPFARARTPVYYGHEGAFFPETMHFWGAYHNGGMGYGWDRPQEPLGRTANQYIRFYWSSGIELLAMMLDYHAFTGDAALLRQTLLPHAAAVLEFYAKHYPREPGGPILFAPAQALETWWTCENPLPEVAGLRFVLKKLLALPADCLKPEQRDEWQQLLAALPPIPLREINGQPVLSPAEAFKDKRNLENPELYAIFPYRHFGVGKPELEMARHTFAHRAVKGSRGWQQDDTQAAFLGLAEEARRMLVSRFATRHEGSRFPAFWGPNFDWIPDQDHGGNGLMALQTMLLQAEGQTLWLFPAWPADWDVEFKLHAPLATTVEGVLRQGRIVRLTVTPKERLADLRWDEERFRQ